jgi:3-methyladenine DNA glycosylase AlkC
VKLSERYQRMRTTQAGILESFLPAPDAALIKALDEWQAEVEERLSRLEMLAGLDSDE